MCGWLGRIFEHVGGLCFALAVAFGTYDPPAPAVASPASVEGKPAESSAAPRQPLKIDLHAAIDEVMARHARDDLPHFEEKVEVRDREQEAVNSRLVGIEQECDEAESGPPNHAELNRYRTYPVPPHWDYVAVAKFLFKTARRQFGSKEPRYFIYAVHTATRDGKAGPAPELVMREGAISEAARSAVPGTGWDLMASFRERDEALRGLARLRQGFSTPQRAFADDRQPPWARSNCRPRPW